MRRVVTSFVMVLEVFRDTSMRSCFSLEEGIYIVRKARVLVYDVGQKFLVLIKLILEKLAVSKVYFVLKSIDI